MILDNCKFWSLSWPRWTAAWRVVFIHIVQNSRVHVEVLHFIRTSSIVSLSHNRIDFVHVRHDCRGYVQIMWPFPSFNFGLPWIFWNTGSCTIHRALVVCNKLTCLFILANTQIQKIPILPDSPLLRQVSPRCHPTTRQGIHLQFHSRTRRFVRSRIFLVLLAGFPTAMSFPRSEEIIRFFADEELAWTIEDKFIAVVLDFATTLSSSFCSCTLFAIFLV